MESHAKFFGHPIHPMLVPLPLGLFIMAVIFDIIFKIFGATSLTTVSYWNIAAGVIAGLLAAVFGFWDWLHVPSHTRAKQIGLMHGGGNVVLVVLFAIAFALRTSAPGYAPSTLPFIIELIGLVLGACTGWLGGELVDRLGVGVDRGANLDAPSSLSGEPAGRSDMGERGSAA